MPGRAQPLLKSTLYGPRRPDVPTARVIHHDVTLPRSLYVLKREIDRISGPM